MTKTRREFAAEFECEAAARLETGGWPRTQVSTEHGLRSTEHGLRPSAPSRAQPRPVGATRCRIAKTSRRSRAPPTLKVELIDRRRRAFASVDGHYNRRRVRSALG